MRRIPIVGLLVAVACAVVAAQRAPVTDTIKPFVKIDAPVVALVNARVIDGTGAPAQEGQTLILRDGRIAGLGPPTQVATPDGATVVDLAGKTVMPGLVMLHEHLYYPTGPGVYGQLGQSFVRLYLAGGVTTMRTGGNMNGFMDLNLRHAIDAGRLPGPSLDATAPYVNGANAFLQMRSMKGPEEARRQVAYWADMGATSFKAYMQISREELAAVIDEAHTRKLKVTGHLCSVTYAEAADLGIDNLEHGFFAATDFVAGKKPDLCPGQGAGQQAVAAIDEQSAAFKALVQRLVEKRVALTSTLTVFETITPGRPMPPGLDVLVPSLRERFEQNHARTSANTTSVYRTLFGKGMALERAFVKAGGTLVVGTDPTAGGGVVPGFANQRALELLVEAGFTPLEAISIATLNGARYLGRDGSIGSLAAGKQADLLIVRGDPSRTIADVRQVDLVFRQGVGYDPVALIDSVKGSVGLW